MLDRDRELALDDHALLARCRVHCYKASGPGGQHRNKVTSAVRLHHADSGISVIAEESRSQHENRRRALGRLRRMLACRLRRPAPDEPPEALRAYIRPAGGQPGRPGRIALGRKNPDFWPVAAVLLDILEAADGSVGRAGDRLGVSTGSLVRLFRSDRHLLAAALKIRRDHGLGPLR